MLQASELRACYVVPEAARKGVGSALVTEIERIPAENGLTQLDLQASTNAEPFCSAERAVPELSHYRQGL